MKTEFDNIIYRYMYSRLDGYDYKHYDSWEKISRLFDKLAKYHFFGALIGITIEVYDLEITYEQKVEKIKAGWADFVKKNGPLL